MKRLNSSPVKQQGAALVVGLIMLLLLTLVGVAGMRDTLLQEKMVGNMRDREIALQAAEAALRDGEAYLNQVVLPDFANNGGIYDLNINPALTQRVVGGKPVSETEFWREWNWDADAVEYSLNLAGVDAKPAYVIERLPQSLTDRGQYAGGNDPTYVMVDDLSEVIETVESIPDYRITARGLGVRVDSDNEPESVVILQSTFRREADQEP